MVKEVESEEILKDEVKMVVGVDIVLYQEAETDLTEEVRNRIKESYPDLIDTVLEAGEHYRTDVLGKEISKDICKSAQKIKIKLEKAVKASNSDRLQLNRDRKNSIDNDNDDFKLLRGIIEPIILTLDGTANHYKLLEEKAISDRRIKRLNKLLELDPEAEEPAGLKTMTEDDFDIYLSGKNIQIENAKTEALRLKKEQDEAEKLTKLKEDRLLECSDYSEHIPEFKTLDFSLMSEDDYCLLLAKAKTEDFNIAWKDAHSELKEKNKEQLLIDKSKLFIKTLLKEGFEKRTRGDYIKGNFTVSVDTLKTLSKREFSDRMIEVNTAIYSKTWDDAHKINAEKIKEAKEIKEAEELETKRLELLAPDKEKLKKFADYLSSCIADHNIDIKDDTYQQIYNNAIDSINEIVEAMHESCDS